jgi:hypothetical protein
VANSGEPGGVEAKAFMVELVDYPTSASASRNSPTRNS